MPRSRPNGAADRRARCALLAVCGALLCATLAGCGPTSFLITPVPGSQDLCENVLRREGPWARDRIALVEVDGVLQNGRPGSLMGVPGENPVALFKEKLDRAVADRRVRGVVVRINSPGGGVTASDLMYTELKHFRERTGKPVVACMLDVAASGGYYVACAADRIYAHPTTVTGSIGVIMIAPEFSGTMEKLGIRANVIKSGALKDAGSLFRRMEQRDREVFERMIGQMYDRFVSVVTAGRPELSEERVRELADGRVYLGSEAQTLGLVDEVGTLDDAIRAVRVAAGVADRRILVVEYARPLAHRPNVYARGDAPGGQVNLINVELPGWLGSPSPGFMYLWAPGW